MSSKSKIILLFIAVLGVLIASVLLYSCNKDNVPPDTKHLDKFHSITTETEGINLNPDDLSLFVDYSNCIAKGMDSEFYQKMESPLTAATKHYWSIKGDTITEESITTVKEGVYGLLNDVEEINYAALDSAIMQMAYANSESVMLTDGELFTKTATKNNPSNPYMHAAFREWLLKGHDIHIIAEPYQETYNGDVFNKKRFYIIFTDDRMEGNIYARIKDIVGFENIPKVTEYHLSGNYIKRIPTKDSSSPNETFAAVITPGDSYEIQEWQIDWKNIRDLITNGCDSSGNPLPNGEKIIGGLNIDKNAFGCYRIKDIEIRVSNINEAYFDLYNKVDAFVSVDSVAIDSIPVLTDFIIFDKKEFEKNGNVDLYFDRNHFGPDGELNGNPFNYFKIDIIIKDIENILSNNIEIFYFDSIVKQGQTNISISESLKNCVFDPNIVNKLKGKVLYTIYVKSDKYKE